MQKNPACQDNFDSFMSAEVLTCIGGQGQLEHVTKTATLLLNGKRLSGSWTIKTNLASFVKYAFVTS